MVLIWYSTWQGASQASCKFVLVPRVSVTALILAQMVLAVLLHQEREHKAGTPALCCICSAAKSCVPAHAVGQLARRL